MAGDDLDDGANAFRFYGRLAPRRFAPRDLSHRDVSPLMALQEISVFWNHQWQIPVFPLLIFTQHFTVSIIDILFTRSSITKRIININIVFDFFLSSLESDDSTSNDDVIRYRILEKGSKRGGRLLVASNGYTYGSKSRRNNKSSTLWRCSVRSAKLQCPATVSQRGHYFQPGTRPHGHPADPRQPIYKEVVALVKEQIESNRHSTASAVVTDILTTLLPEEQHFLAPKYDLLKRIANRHRAGKRPRVPAATPNATSVCFSPLPLSRQLTGRGDHNVE